MKQMQQHRACGLLLVMCLCLLGAYVPGFDGLILTPSLPNQFPDRMLIGQGLPTKVGAYLSTVVTTPIRFHMLSSAVHSSDTTGAGQVGGYGAAEGLVPGANVWSLNILVQVPAAMTRGVAIGYE